MQHTETIATMPELAGQVQPLTEEEQRAMEAAIARARHLQAEQLAARGGVPFPSSGELLNELRDERSRQLA